MRYIIFVFFIVVLHNFAQANKVQKANLVFAQVLFRHGDRNPLSTYPNDPWKDSWPEGYGQLTKLGMQQEYNLGQYFRKRYDALLPKEVYPNKLVYCRSTDRERTLMSAAALLAGLFPPTVDQVWNENINWQPVPIHTVPRIFDYKMSPAKVCERLLFLRKEHYKRPEYMAWKQKYQHIYEYVAEKSGLSVDGDNIGTIYDNLLIQKIHNKTFPEWAVNIYSEIEKLSNFEDIYYIGTREMSRLRSGYLLGDIIERFNSKINGTLQPNRSLWLYSAHDTTIYNFLNVLGLLNSQSEAPKYSASILLELYEQGKEYFVQVFYKNSEKEHISPLEIAGCGTLCPLKKFHEIYKPFIPINDFDTECKV